MNPHYVECIPFRGFHKTWETIVELQLIDGHLSIKRGQYAWAVNNATLICPSGTHIVTILYVPRSVVLYTRRHGGAYFTSWRDHSVV